MCEYVPTFTGFQNIFNLLKDLNIVPAVITRHIYVVALIAHWIALSSTVWNPLLYAGMNEQVREGLIDILPTFIKKFSTVSENRSVVARIRARLGSLPLNEAHQNLRMTVAKHVAASLHEPDSAVLDYAQTQNYYSTCNRLAVHRRSQSVRLPAGTQLHIRDDREKRFSFRLLPWKHQPNEEMFI